VIHRTITAVLLTVELSSCGVVFWTTEYTSSQPDGKASIEVQLRGCLDDCALRIVAKQDRRAKQIAWGNDCIVSFAEAAWSGSTVAIFVDGGTCPPIRVAYDFSKEQRVDFESFAPSLRAAIVKDYAVTSEELEQAEGDVFRWITDPKLVQRARIEFRKRGG
jgi:hypothetical protein